MKVEISKDEFAKAIRIKQQMFVLWQEQIMAVRELLTELASSLMKATMDLNSAVTAATKKANEDLEILSLAGHASGDQAAAQSSVDDIFAMASSRLDNILPAMESDKDRLRRNHGRYSKSVEAITLLAADLDRILLEVVDRLTTEDVIKQKAENIENICHFLSNQLLPAVATQINSRNQSTIINQAFQQAMKRAAKECRSVEEKNILAECQKAIDAGTTERTLLRHFVGDLQGIAHLLTQYVDEIRRALDSSLAKVMQELLAIDSSSQRSARHRDTALLENAAGEYQQVSMTELDKQSLPDASVEGRPHLDGPIQLFHDFNEQLGVQLQSLAGQLSVIDVIDQRLETTAKTMRSFATHSQLQNPCQAQQLAKVLEATAAQFKTFYRSTEEVALFEKIFPKPR